MYIHDKYTHTPPHNHTNSHTNNYYECPIEMDDMIHRLETTDGSVGQFLRPVGMMYTFQTHIRTEASQSTDTISPQPHFKSEHVLLLN